MAEAACELLLHSSAAQLDLVAFACHSQGPECWPNTPSMAADNARCTVTQCTVASAHSPVVCGPCAGWHASSQGPECCPLRKPCLLACSPSHSLVVCVFLSLYVCRPWLSCGYTWACRQLDSPSSTTAATSPSSCSAVQHSHKTGASPTCCCMCSCFERCSTGCSSARGVQERAGATGAV